MEITEFDEAVLGVLEFGEGATAYQIRMGLGTGPYQRADLRAVVEALERLCGLGLASRQERKRAYLPADKVRYEYQLTLEALQRKPGT